MVESSEHELPLIEGMGGSITEKNKENFWGDVNVLYFDAI